MVGDGNPNNFVVFVMKCVGSYSVQTYRSIFLRLILSEATAHSSASAVV